MSVPCGRGRCPRKIHETRSPAALLLRSPNVLRKSPRLPPRPQGSATVLIRVNRCPSVVKPDCAPLPRPCPVAAGAARGRSTKSVPPAALLLRSPNVLRKSPRLPPRPQGSATVRHPCESVSIRGSNPARGVEPAQLQFHLKSDSKSVGNPMRTSFPEGSDGAKLSRTQSACRRKARGKRPEARGGKAYRVRGNGSTVKGHPGSLTLK
jgi:hypothetical protein